MKPEKEKLDLLLQIVAQTFGTTPHTPTDFVALASAVQESTGRTIGLSTLKRLWGYIKDQTGTTYSTLSLLSRYTGYSDWDSFCRFASLITDEQKSGFSKESIIESRLVAVGTTISIRLGATKHCTLKKINEPDGYTVTEGGNIKLREGDTVRVACMAIGRPFFATDCRRGIHPLGTYTGARIEKITHSADDR